MKALITAFLLLLRPMESAGDSTLRLMFWNLENFFDYRKDSLGVKDAEFWYGGERRWTKKRFKAKCQAIAKTVLWTAGECGGLPDAIGLAEVENRKVLKRLIYDTALQKLDYRIVHFDSGDRRGIDVALLYRESWAELISAKACHIYGADSARIQTRDILLAHFLTADGKDLAILVNHHPSKYGGSNLSEQRRMAAVKRLRQVTDSLKQCGIDRIVAMGDFNDTPDSPIYHILDLINLSTSLHEKGEGSIRFEGKWELIDQIFVSERLKDAQMRIIRAPFLMVRDKKYTGEKPFRTYSGPRYIGGVSDHCPVWMDYKAPINFPGGRKNAKE